jgi:hypothetical protein
MTKPLDVFCEIPCLTEQSSQLSGIVLQKNGLDQRTKELLANTFKNSLTIIQHYLSF